MTIRLIRHHVLIKLDDPLEADEQLRRAKAAGIYVELDKREKEIVEIGTVVQIGPTAFNDLGFDTPPIKVGDRVSLIRSAGKKTQDLDGSLYHLYNDDDILAILE